MAHRWYALDWCSKINQTLNFFISAELQARLKREFLSHTGLHFVIQIPKTTICHKSFTSLLQKLSFILYKKLPTKILLDHQFSSVTQSYPILCDSMNCSIPGLLVHHQLPEFAQTHVHRVSDAIQPSYPLSSPSPPAPNPCQHQSLFQWVNSLHEVAKVLEFQL